jgi:hypothetical protein
MKPEQMTEVLEQAAHQLGIKVRYETLTGETMGAGGLCKIRGEWAVIIDRRANASDRAALLVESLASFDTDSVFLPPELREAVVQRRAARARNDAPPPAGSPPEPEPAPESEPESKNQP